MMPRFCLFALILMTTASISLHLQAQSDAEWQPDPAEIFADGVQWEVIEAEESTYTPSVQVDSENRLVLVYDESLDEWLEFPYPDDEVNIYQATRRTDGTIYIQTRGYDGFSPYRYFANPDDVLILEPETGDYSAPQTVCEGHYVRALEGSGRWGIVRRDSETIQSFLCHSETGEIRDVLPENIYDWTITPTSNDERFLVIGLDINNSGDFHAFSYHLVNDELISLGLTNSGVDDELWICKWLTETRAILCKAGLWGDDTGTAYYTVDISEADSMEHLFTGWRENTFVLKEPLRYVSLHTYYYVLTNWGIGGESGPQNIPCELRIFDGLTLFEQILAFNCLTMWANDFNDAPYYRHDDKIYYLAVDSFEATVSNLKNFDVINIEESDTLFSGEIESVISVSPDERYIVLLMDDNQELDFFSNPNYCCSRRGGWQVVILDQQTGDIVYQSEPIGVFIPTQVHWLDEQTLVIGALTDIDPETGTETSASLRRISIENGTIDELVTLDYSIENLSGFETHRLSSDRQHWLRDNQIIDLRNLEVIPILREDIANLETLSIGWQEDNSLHVTINNPENGEQSVEYRVIVDLNS